MICVNYLVTGAACQKLPPIMPALQSMLFDAYYSPNYANIFIFLNYFAITNFHFAMHIYNQDCYLVTLNYYSCLVLYGFVYNLLSKAMHRW